MGLGQGSSLLTAAGEQESCLETSPNCRQASTEKKREQAEDKQKKRLNRPTEFKVTIFPGLAGMLEFCRQNKNCNDVAEDHELSQNHMLGGFGKP